MATVDAVAWDPWLTTELGVQAEKMGLGYDGGEESEDFEVFDFEGPFDQVERAIGVVLVGNGVFRQMVKDGDTVTVEGTGGRSMVSYATTDTAYGKAMRRVTRELSERQDLTEVRLEPGELYLMHYTDLSIMDEKPSRAEAERVAREHVNDILEQVAKYLDHPLG